MRLALLAALLLVGCKKSPPATDASSADVLFIGNSYTYVNDLPAMTTQILASATPPVVLQVESVTRGGATLGTMWHQSDARQRIENGHYRFVVLQGQSVEPCSELRADYIEFAHRFAELAVKHGARPLLYVTWPRREGSEVFLDPKLPHSVEEMNACLRAGADAAAAGTRIELVDVRARWMTAIADRPTTNLYADDRSHPSVAGTFLAANVFARAFEPGFTQGTWRPPGLVEADAAYLER